MVVILNQPHYKGRTPFLLEKATALSHKLLLIEWLLWTPLLKFEYQYLKT